jgi:hypothetical protein
MVYNAMKLFMEVNPGLYDQCYQTWVEAHTEKPTKEQIRNAKWDKLAAAAKTRGINGVSTTPQKAAQPPSLLPVTTSVGDKIESSTGEISPSTSAHSPSAPGAASSAGSVANVDGDETTSQTQEGDPMHERLSRFHDLSIQEASIPGALGHSQAPPRSSNLGTPSSAPSSSFHEEEG